MKIYRWGNDLAIRIPASIVRELDLKVGDDYEIEICSRQRLRILLPGKERSLLVTLAHAPNHLSHPALPDSCNKM